MPKFITFATLERCCQVAKEMNPNHRAIENCETRGNSYYKWIFSDDAVVLCHAQGQGKIDGRFANLWLIRGTAWKVGRDETDLEYYNEKVIVKEWKKKNTKVVVNLL